MLKKNMRGEDEEKQKKKSMLMIHCYIQWTYNLMPEIIFKMLGIKKNNGEDQFGWRKHIWGTEKKFFKVMEPKLKQQIISGPKVQLNLKK